MNTIIDIMDLIVIDSEGAQYSRVYYLGISLCMNSMIDASNLLQCAIIFISLITVGMLSTS